jgi:hypothetical protein
MRRDRARARARARRQEGAIFVEALTVIGLILVCMQCIWWMYEYCLFQHRAHVEARQKAWEVALKGCGDPDPKGPMSSISPDPTSIGEISDGSSDPPGWFAVITGAEQEVSLDLPEEVFGSSVVGAKQKFACNEKGGKQELQLIGGDDSKQYEDQAFAETEPPK